MSNWKEQLMTVMVFVALVFATAYLAPFVLTNETYDAQSAISPRFPIAIIENGVPSVIYWSDYKKRQAKPELILTSMQRTLIVGETKFLTVKISAANKVSIVQQEDNYKFWSSYTIEDGEVNPKSFRYSGIFIIVYSVIAAVIGSSIFSFFRKRYMKISLPDSLK